MCALGGDIRQGENAYNWEKTASKSILHNGTFIFSFSRSEAINIQNVYFQLYEQLLRP